MKRRWIQTLLIWLLLTGVAQADGDFAVELVQIDTSRYPEITLYVSVRDRDGQIAEGLQEEDFKITEDGTPVKIIAFSAGIRSAISTVLAIDRSSSMEVENKMDGAKSAAMIFVELMRKGDQAALVAFNEDVVTVQPFTSDRDALAGQIQSLYADGCTAWYDAVYLSVDLIAPLKGRRSIILLSDGIDCREDPWKRLLEQGSSHTLDEAIQHARRAGIPVYAIGFGQKATQSVGREGFDEVKLRRVAIETGGKFYHAPNADELKHLYQSLSVEMQKEYVLTYHSPRPTYDGTRRNIIVTVQRGTSGPGAIAHGRYLEQHLINLRSDPGLFLAFLLPLLLLLALPAVTAKVRTSTSQPMVEPIIGDGHGPLQHSELAEPPAAPIPSQPTPPTRLIARFPLNPEGTHIGREPDNDIVLNHPSVAAYHARIVRQGKWYVIHDLGQGQTFVSFSGDPTREQMIRENALKDGSSVRLGDVRCTVSISPDGSTGYIEIPFPLQGTVTTIGRDSDNDIVVKAPKVAPRQAEIHREGNRFVIHDISPGGALLVSFSGDPAQERPVRGRNALKSGSTLRFGNVVFRLEE